MGSRCYLPPGRGDITAFMPQPKLVLDVGTRRDATLSWLRDCSKGAQPVPKTAYHSGCRDKHNRPRCDSNLDPLTPQSDVLTTRPLRPAVVCNSAVAEGPRDAPGLLKPCEMLHKYSSNSILIDMQRARDLQCHPRSLAMAWISRPYDTSS